MADLDKAAPEQEVRTTPQEPWLTTPRRWALAGVGLVVALVLLSAWILEPSPGQVLDEEEFFAAELEALGHSLDDVEFYHDADPYGPVDCGLPALGQRPVEWTGEIHAVVDAPRRHEVIRHAEELWQDRGWTLEERRTLEEGGEELVFARGENTFELTLRAMLREDLEVAELQLVLEDDVCDTIGDRAAPNDPEVPFPTYAEMLRAARVPDLHAPGE